MNYFAILDTETGLLFPEVKMSYTRVEIGPWWSAHSPRLLTSEGAAKSALTWWLKGVTYQGTDTEDDGWGRYYTVSTGPEGPIKPLTPRDPNRFEVVEVVLGFCVKL